MQLGNSHEHLPKASIGPELTLIRSNRARRSGWGENRGIAISDLGVLLCCAGSLGGFRVLAGRLECLLESKAVEKGARGGVDLKQGEGRRRLGVGDVAPRR